MSVTAMSASLRSHPGLDDGAALSPGQRDGGPILGSMNTRFGELPQSVFMGQGLRRDDAPGRVT
jgi:hypothetical protein